MFLLAVLQMLLSAGLVSLEKGPSPLSCLVGVSECSGRLKGGRPACGSVGSLY